MHQGNTLFGVFFKRLKTGMDRAAWLMDKVPALEPANRGNNKLYLNLDGRLEIAK